jgi:hypothetical protein
MEASSRKDQADMGIKLGGIARKKRGQAHQGRGRDERRTHCYGKHQPWTVLEEIGRFERRNSLFRSMELGSLHECYLALTFLQLGCEQQQMVVCRNVL